MTNTNKSKDKKLSDRLSSVGGVITILFAVYGAGIGTATYVGNLLKKIEINEINQAHNVELEQQSRIFYEKIDELRIEIDQLRQANNLLEIENKQYHENEKRENK